MGKKQASTQGEVTSDVGDKDPFRRKIQTIKSAELFGKKPKQLGAVAAKKHVTVFSVNERRKDVRNQITIGNFVYKRSGARVGSPLYDKWYKLYKGESVEEAIKRRGKEEVIVDSPPNLERFK
jgi:hypothetical protein